MSGIETQASLPNPQGGRVRWPWYVRTSAVALCLIAGVVFFFATPGNKDAICYNWSTADGTGGIIFNRDGTGVIGVSYGGQVTQALLRHLQSGHPGVIGMSYGGEVTLTRFKYKFIDQNTVELEFGSGWAPARPGESTRKIRMNIDVSENMLETTDMDGNTVKYTRRLDASDH